MINLLPPIEKENLLAEERLKIVLILGVIVLVFFASLILAFVSVNFSLGIQLKSQDIILENEENQSERAGIEIIGQEINQVNKDMALLASFYNQKINMTGFLEKISDLLPEKVYLNSVSINPLGANKNIFQVVLSGHASSIEDVIGLRETLTDDEQFSNISFPQDIWFKKEDFFFDVTFQANIQK